MQKTSLDSRKPIDGLRPADLAAFPIWAFIAIAAKAAAELGATMGEPIPLHYRLVIPVETEAACREGVYTYPLR